MLYLSNDSNSVDIRKTAKSLCNLANTHNMKQHNNFKNDHGNPLKHFFFTYNDVKVMFLILQLRLPLRKTYKTPKMLYNFNKTDFNLINKKLRDISWNSAVTRETNTDSALQKIYFVINEIISINTPEYTKYFCTFMHWL